LVDDRCTLLHASRTTEICRGWPIAPFANEIILRGSDESTVMRCSPKFLKIIKVMEYYDIVSEEW